MFSSLEIISWKHLKFMWSGKGYYFDSNRPHLLFHYDFAEPAHNTVKHMFISYSATYGSITVCL